jgi:hypothetical protein
MAFAGVMLLRDPDGLSFPSGDELKTRRDRGHRPALQMCFSVFSALSCKCSHKTKVLYRGLANPFSVSADAGTRHEHSQSVGWPTTNRIKTGNSI